MRVSKGTFSKPTKVKPDYNQPGGGMERTATGKVPIEVIKVKSIINNDCKLNILEPWEFGTEKGIEIKDFDKFNNHILLHIKNPYIIDNEPYNFLLAKMRRRKNKLTIFYIF